MPSLLFTYSYNHLYLGSTATRLPPAYQLLSRVAHFWVPFRAKCLEEQTLTGYKTCRKQDLWLLTELEKLKFTSLIIRPGTAAKRWFLIMKLLSVQLFSLRNTVHFDNALHILGRLLQPKHSVPAVQTRLSTPVCFVLIWSLNMVGKHSQLISGIVKTMGQETTTTVF